jgi:hypothetical protein
MSFFSNSFIVAFIYTKMEYIIVQHKKAMDKKIMVPSKANNVLTINNSFL